VTKDVAIYNEDYPEAKKIGNLGLGDKILVSAKHFVSPGCFVRDGFIKQTDLMAQSMTCLKYLKSC